MTLSALLEQRIREYGTANFHAGVALAPDGTQKSENVQPVIDAKSALVRQIEEEIRGAEMAMTRELMVYKMRVDELHEEVNEEHRRAEAAEARLRELEALRGAGKDAPR